MNKYLDRFLRDLGLSLESQNPLNNKPITSASCMSFSMLGSWALISKKQPS